VSIEELKRRIETDENNMMKLMTSLYELESKLLNQMAEMGKYIQRQQEQIDKLKEKLNGQANR